MELNGLTNDEDVMKAFRQLKWLVFERRTDDLEDTRCFKQCKWYTNGFYPVGCVCMSVANERLKSETKGVGLQTWVRLGVTDQ